MWKNLTATGFAGALLAMAVTPSAADEQFIPYQAVQLPDAQVLSAFDISFVDAASRTYVLSGSRIVGSGGTFGAVIVVNTDLNLVTKELTGFVGDCTTPPNRNNWSGPNGSMIIKKGRNTEVWAGDGPVFSTTCNENTPLATPSTVKAFDLASGAMIASIQTGILGSTTFPGIRRADELCANSSSNVVLIANDDPADNFITFINADTYQVIQRISFAGGDSNAVPPGIPPASLIANGIEQCAFNPKDGNFYINLPNTVSTPTTLACGTTGAPPCLNGVTLRISGKAPFHVEAIVADYRPPAPGQKPTLSGTGCTGGSGLKFGPDYQLANSCAVIIDYRYENKLIATFPASGGADEIWYNPGDDHYFFANSTCKQTVPNGACLGVVDAGPPASADPIAQTAPGSHSVAADSDTNLVYVPVRGNNGTVPPTACPPTGTACGAVCSKASDVFGLAGSDALGCILTYIAPRDSDDR
jgi:hypothetical protein